MWALMYIVDVVHKQDVLHNDLNPNNVILHFPWNRGGAIFIGICDWGMATWIQEEAPSTYGKKNKEDLRKHRAKYYCAAPKLFDVIRERRTLQSPMRMARAHKHIIKSESYSIGMLAKKIYRMDATSTLFQQNRDANSVKVRFEQALLNLTSVDSAERQTVTYIVNILKGPPYNMETPNMCFRDTVV